MDNIIRSPIYPVPIWPLARPGGPDLARELLPVPTGNMWDTPKPPITPQFCNVFPNLDAPLAQRLVLSNRKAIPGPIGTSGIKAMSGNVSVYNTGVLKG